jgi:hypothetical protein
MQAQVHCMYMHKFILYMYRSTYITHACACVCALRAHTHAYGNLACYACLMRTRIHHYCQENKNKARRNRGEQQRSMPQTHTQTQTHRLTHTHLRAFMSTHKIYKWLLMHRQIHEYTRHTNRCHMPTYRHIKPLSTKSPDSKPSSNSDNHSFT